VRRQFRQVGVFTAARYLGNPVAAALDGEGLHASEMQVVTRSATLSKTTSVLPPRGDRLSGVDLAGGPRRLMRPLNSAGRD
jgi:predicted PhzF superfamily epimerase YddE/YHI9